MRLAIAALLVAIAVPAYAQDAPPPAAAQDAPANAAQPAPAQGQQPDQNQGAPLLGAGQALPAAPEPPKPVNPPMTGPRILISTSMGDITVQMDAVRAPASVAVRGWTCARAVFATTARRSCRLRS